MIPALRTFEKRFMEAKKLPLGMSISSEDFEYFRKIIYKSAGISLSPSKLELMQSRLKSRLSSLGLEDFSEYRVYLEGLDEFDPEWQNFINVLTTNKTDWFRENQHFQYLTETFLPKWKKLGQKHLSVWCAAA